MPAAKGSRCNSSRLTCLDGDDNLETGLFRWFQGQQGAEAGVSFGQPIGTFNLAKRNSQRG
jgi:hypothetical protein